MYKPFKYFAPIVLVIYICTFFAGFGWAEQIRIDSREVTVSTKFKPEVLLISKEFDLIIKAKYQGDTLTDLQLDKNESFKEIIDRGMLNAGSTKNADDSKTFRLKAPSKPGTYECYFIGKSINGSPVRFSVPIKVDNYDLSNAKAAKAFFILGCGVLGTLIGGNTLASAWGKEGGLAGIILGAGIGCGAGCVGGFFVGFILADMIWPNLKE
jgi:hypothetical protein